MTKIDATLAAPVQQDPMNDQESKVDLAPITEEEMPIEEPEQAAPAVSIIAEEAPVEVEPEQAAPAILIVEKVPTVIVKPEQPKPALEDCKMLLCLWKGDQL